LPDPIGPRTPRTNAFELWNFAKVGSARYRKISMILSFLFLLDNIVFISRYFFLKKIICIFKKEAVK
jgi:hypothetical protein